MILMTRKGEAMKKSIESPAGKRGFSLVEVLIAVALTGVVVLAVMTLFTLGHRNVYSGKQMSAANAVATRVLEDMAAMTGTDVLTHFGITDTTSLTDNVVNGVTYTGSVLRDTDGTIDTNTDAGGYLARWRALVSPQANFNSGRLVLAIIPANPTVVDDPVSTAQVVRVRGIVQWNEGVRRRTVTFDTSKLIRP
jgi:prepilin-type N-terminal cleavage/methylation domain-containing protein